ncbi:MAG: ROK family glucokinase [Hespellia sp.]|nr:ROK family glucokinase [Hespellia sp.]
MKYCFGVDIGGTTTKMGLFEAGGEILDKWEIVSHTENGGEAVLPDIAEALGKKIAEYKINEQDVIGVGVGVPAPVNAEGIVKDSANIGWGYKEVKRELEELTGLDAEIGNDANVAALGEMWKGGGMGQKNMIMITLGTGVGGGVIVDGRLVVGANGAGGEIGHICVNYEETESCGCGNFGCLEQYASATGIVRLANQRLNKDEKESMLRHEKVTAKAVFDAVKAGDEVAKEIAEEFGRYLGNAIANMAVIADPTIIVIGGGVSKAGEVLLSYIEKPFQDRAFFANKEMKFSLATLGNDAGICGAAKLVLDKNCK